MNMLRFLLGVTVALIFGALETTAQDNNLERNLRIVFIDHEPSLPTNRVIAHIRKMRAQALENDNSIIFYMPNNQNPFLALVNVKDPDGENDTQEAFDRLCEALNLPSHNKEPWYDRKSMVNLFSDYNIVDDEKNLMFAAVRMEFYLTSEFWKLGYNESILAPLFFAIDGKTLLQHDFNFDVYVSEEDKPEYSEGKPFGDINLGDINNYISVYEFDF